MSGDLAPQGADFTVPNPLTAPMPADLPPPLCVRTHPLGGLQALWRFPNRRGASVARFHGSHGTELLVTRYHGEGIDAWDHDYSTPITDDIVPGIDSPDELFDLLRAIRDLPPPTPEIPR